MGRVWNSERKRMSTGSVRSRNGYVEITLSKKGEKPKGFALHRLVAKHFIPNPENKEEVNHLGEKTDNRACMLEWVTGKENCAHSVEHKLNHYIVSVQKLDPLDRSVLKTYPSTKLAEEDGFKPSSIRQAIRKNVLYKGFYWKYTEDKKEEIIENEKWYKLEDSIYDEVNCFPKYQVSNQGRIKSQHGHIMKINFSKTVGVVTLVNKNIKTNFTAHRLIIMGCNVPNPESKPEVDHIDSNCQNNVLSNLRWANRKEQMNNIETLKKISKPNTKVSYKIEITICSTKEVKTYIGLDRLSKELHISRETIKKYADLGTEFKGYIFRIIKN